MRLKDKYRCIDNTKGFGLLDLFIALAIIVVLLSMIAPNALSYVRKANKLSDIVTAREIGRQVELQLTDPVFKEGVERFYKRGSKYPCNVVDDSDPRNPKTYVVYVLGYSVFWDSTIHERMRNDATVARHNGCITQMRASANDAPDHLDEGQALFKQLRIDMDYVDLGLPKYDPGHFPYSRLVSGYDRPPEDYQLNRWVVTQRKDDKFNIEVWVGSDWKWTRPVYKLYPAYSASPVYE